MTKREVNEDVSKTAHRVLIVVLCMMSLYIPASAKEISPLVSQEDARAQVIREIRHELVTLPYYGVFDWLEKRAANSGSGCKIVNLSKLEKGRRKTVSRAETDIGSA